MQDPADFVIVGGGTAGTVLAARLSEHAGTRVVLIEAGRDTPAGAVPADIDDTFPSSSLNRAYFWPGLHARRRGTDPQRPYLQARIMGGGSSVMGMWALRGLPADYDAWAAAGATGWDWASVAPTFAAIEDDADRDRADGAVPAPVPIRRLPRDDWPAFARALGDAAAARGLALVEDANATPGDGFFALPLSQDARTRASNARCYLTDAVRRRPNLTILAETQVTALTIVGGTAVGVSARRHGETVDIPARAVVLAAGAIHSPALLLRAGIGPADDLAAAGVAPLVDRAGVGRNLQNHPYLHFALTLPPAGRMAAALRRGGVAGLRFSSGLPGCTASDLLAFVFGRVSPRPFGTAVAMVGAAVYAPHSRGHVRLAGPDPQAAPEVSFGMLDDPRDAGRMLLATRFAEALLYEPAVAAHYNEAFLLPPVMSLQQFNRPGLGGALFAVAAGAALDAPAAIRRRLFGRAIRPGRWLGPAERRMPVTDDEILAAAAPMAHPAGTCAMGRSDDPAAVVDPHGRVHGVGNLYVADASVMPRLPAANTNLPTTMVAERIATLIRGERG